MTTVSSLCRSTVPLFSIIFCARDQLDCPITSLSSPQKVVRSRPWQRENDFCHSNSYSQLGILEEHGIDLVDDLLAERVAIVRVRSFRGHHHVPKRPDSTPYKLCAWFPGSKAPSALRPTHKTQAKTDTTHERPEQHRTLPNNGQHRKNLRSARIILIYFDKRERPAGETSKEGTYWKVNLLTVTRISCVVFDCEIWKIMHAIISCPEI